MTTLPEKQLQEGKVFQFMMAGKAWPNRQLMAAEACSRDYL